ncbi:hypothetical protein AGR7B_pAt0127 [Agrobacterium deltaense RV3]|nr:hypothetical protein AGR7B_pAt0127 [Agrobacterium deltaense RV3]
MIRAYLIGTDVLQARIDVPALLKPALGILPVIRGVDQKAARTECLHVIRRGLRDKVAVSKQLAKLRMLKDIHDGHACLQCPEK